MKAHSQVGQATNLTAIIWILSSLAQPLDCAINVDQHALGTQSNPTGWLCQTRSYHDSYVYITHLILLTLATTLSDGVQKTAKNYWMFHGTD